MKNHKTNKVKNILFLAALITLIPLSAANAADPNLGRNLAATCANCHGTNGVSLDNNVESLAGKNPKKLMRDLNDFRSGAYPATIMHQIVKGYTDKQLALIVQYFANQK